MEAPLSARPRAARILFTLGLALLAGPLPAAEFRTANFVVTAPTADVARQVAETAESFRHELAIDWLGKELPNWYRPCPVKVTIGPMGAGGATTFTFDRGEVSGWNMRVQGSLERVLDSVIPHEVSHTIFASHFRRPLPRWADEGAATLIEHPDERKRQEVLLQRVIKTARRIPLDNLLAMSEYPSDMQQVYTLYAEGYSLANFLVQQHGPEGKAVFLQFLQDAHQQGWKSALQTHYEFSTVGELEQTWSGWVLAGSPPRRRPEGESLAANSHAAEAAGHGRLGPLRAAVSRAAAEPDVIALAPLPPISRALRQPRLDDGLSAPRPGDARPAAKAGQPADRALADSGADARVIPRVSPFPAFDPAAARRMRQVREQTLAAAQPGRQVSTARTQNPAADAVLRGQSPKPRHWSEFAAFPQQASASGTDDQGRAIPFSR